MIPSSAGRELLAGPDDDGRRLDKVLRVLLKDRALSEIYAALRKGRILVNGRKADPATRIEEGDRLFLDSSFLDDNPEPRLRRGKEDLAELAGILLLATEDLIFINKPRGELSQGPGGLEPRIRQALAGRSSASLSFVPGPLHRLDRNTTGVLAFPRSAEGARAFTSMLRERRIEKRYLALLDGETAAPEEWRDRIARDEGSLKSRVVAGDAVEGDEAFAEMRPLLSRGGRSLVLVLLHSGLTHQIRVQASSRGMPLSGDRKYGGKDFPGGYILHALSLGFPEPPFRDLPGIVSAPLPEGAIARLDAIFGSEARRSALDLAAIHNSPELRG
jgi:23S rRNA pseudouridine955/2504/2580 synthase